MQIIEGNLHIKSAKIAIVAARFNSLITKQLIEGAKDGLLRHGVEEDDITLAWVPGAYEVPLLAKVLADSQKYDAIICLGAVIRGSTPHFDFVANEAAKGIAHVSMATNLPIVFGILTTDSIEQAIERAGTKAGNKGFDAAMTAIEMINVINMVK